MDNLIIDGKLATSSDLKRVITQVNNSKKDKDELAYSSKNKAEGKKW